MLQDDILKRFRGEGGSGPLFLPNLNLWYGWHAGRGTLPQPWHDLTLPEIAAELGVPAWLTTRPYRVDVGEVAVITTEQDGQRTVVYEAPSGRLTERWTLGPDGDWWQTEFAAKTREDLPVVREIMQLRSYIYDPAELTRKQAEAGESGIAALELPRRPFSQLFLEWLGWSDGLLLFFDAQELAAEIMQIVEEKLQKLVRQIAGLPGDIVVSPDNLDAQFISPALFRRHLADSYRRSVEVLHQHDKILLAGTGGPIARLLKPLAGAGVDGVEGICGPPQSDASLAEARELAGPAFTLWGGIPQDALLPDWDEARFQAAVTQAVQEAQADRRAILGVADVVPIDADIARLQAIPALLAAASI